MWKVLRKWVVKIEKYTNLEIDYITVIATLACAEHKAVKYCKNKIKANKWMHLPVVIDTKPELACENINQAGSYLKMTRLINRWIWHAVIKIKLA